MAIILVLQAFDPFVVGFSRPISSGISSRQYVVCLHKTRPKKNRVKISRHERGNKKLIALLVYQHLFRWSLTVEDVSHLCNIGFTFSTPQDLWAMGEVGKRDLWRYNSLGEIFRVTRNQIESQFPTANYMCLFISSCLVNTCMFWSVFILGRVWVSGVRLSIGLVKNSEGFEKRFFFKSLEKNENGEEFHDP